MALLEFLFKDIVNKVANPSIGSKAVGRRLKKHCGAPIGANVNGQPCTLILKAKPQSKTNPHAAVTFWLRIIHAAEKQDKGGASVKQQQVADEDNLEDMPF